ncbi:hypothetical protein AV656_11045 [Bhargavaea cecembensis]|uniref:DUF600 domain-containing protein n=1 Tax=Bhargavaea cecembensis TaxID=394098 RepID=A0A161RHR1_9BACL|nr:hypothetical protein [Bhargavaea cecembensis]KZE37588.1 hypothetical protein AV656_11045 [Bhargavaea cecembensis]
MVAVCMEYVEDRADDIYIYGSYEPEMYSWNVFYRVSGKVVRKHRLNDALQQSHEEVEQYDVSDERQRLLLKVGMEDLTKLHDLCREYNMDCPTEIKLHYDVKENKLAAKYQYDLIYSNDEELLPSHIFDAWFEEVKNQETD